MDNLNHINIKKKWTLLIYADGNNDLEPEVYESFQNIQKESINENTNVIIQIGRASRDLIKLLRPQLDSEMQEDWNGVRRYMIDGFGTNLLDDLGNVNMAAPNSLSDFLIWGIKQYPAEHIMVILSGHGSGFVGLMTDYMNNFPCAMSLKGVINALIQTQDSTNKQIDCMVLDTCFMNMVEVWYELANIPNLPVQYLLTPLRENSLNGLPCHLILRFLQEQQNTTTDIQTALINTTKSINDSAAISDSLLFIPLLPDVFEELKKEIGHLSDLLLENKVDFKTTLDTFYSERPNYPLMSLLDLTNIFMEKFPILQPVCERIQRLFNTIMLYPFAEQLPKGKNCGPSLYFFATPQQYLFLHNFYHYLTFTNHNNWINVLQEQLPDLYKSKLLNHKKYNTHEPPSLIRIGISTIIHLILQQNPHLTKEDAIRIIEKMGWEQKKPKILLKLKRD